MTTGCLEHQKLPGETGFRGGGDRQGCTPYQRTPILQYIGPIYILPLDPKTMKNEGFQPPKYGL